MVVINPQGQGRLRDDGFYLVGQEESGKPAIVPGKPMRAF